MKKYESIKTRLALAKSLAEEGIVLLENKNNILPLQTGDSIAVFGRAQLETAIGGSGSGASSSKQSTIILNELKNSGLLTNSILENYYRAKYSKLLADSPSEEEKKADFEGLVNSGMIYEIFGRYTPPEPEFIIPEEIISTIDPVTTAIFVIGRVSGGEECDRRVEEDYYLTRTEKEMIYAVANHFSKVIIILNTNGLIDLTWAKKYSSIKAVIYLGTAGEQGAVALANIVTGKVSPSGKLSATIALSYNDYPSSKNFFTNKDKRDTILTYEDYQLSSRDNGSIGFAKSPVALYEEGIYVGYRYFDTFNRQVLYPFGYGLSYAEFQLELLDSKICEESLALIIQVTNTSQVFSGKEVAQIYVSTPDGVLEKPYQELIAYEKTRCLLPGESELLTILLPFSQLACYEEASASYIIEAEDYYIRLGNSSRNSKIVGKINVIETIITAKYQNRIGLRKENKDKLSFLSKKNALSYTYYGEEQEKDKAAVLCTLKQNLFTIKTTEGNSGDVNSALTFTEESNVSNTNTFTNSKSNSSILSDSPYKTELNIDIDTKYTLYDVKSGKVSMHDYVAQLSLEELAVLVNGYGPGLPFGGMAGKYPSTITYKDGKEIGTTTHPTGSVGYISPALLPYGIPSVFYKDGPAGVGMIAWPTGMSMACTFNKSLLYEFGNACGTEAEQLHVDSWLAPAVNIQRDPIGGRNFEYYSEDPRHTGYCGLAITLGVEENNKVSACPKHFAINEQETYRRGNLKNNYDCLDSIIEERAAREIYLKPFEMIIRGSNVSTLMTSFNKINGTFAAGNKDLCIGILREEWNYKGVVVTDWGDMDIVVDGADAVAAGNDIIMPGGPPVIKQVLKGYEEGRCSLLDLQKATSNLLSFVMNTGSFDLFIKN